MKKNRMENHGMKTLFLKFYDKMIVGLLASFFLFTSCKEPDEPKPMYGIVPMYGVPAQSLVIEKSHQPQKKL